MIKFLIYLIIFTSPSFAGSDKNQNRDTKWEISENEIFSESLIWKKKDKPSLEFLKISYKKYKFEYDIKALGRSVTVNDFYYPEISNYVPNAYIESSNKTFTAFIRGISKTRFCQGENFSKTCRDGIFDIDFNLINYEKFSFNPKLTVQSLSDRGTKFGEASSFGFKSALKISPKWSLAFGGENIIHFDNKSDLGRNFYLVGSTFYPLNSREKPAILFLNAGIGSDFYGYGGNGYIARTSCLGKPNLTGEGTDFCNWGPIGSITIAFNDKVSLINEWFGYGYGTGISFRPIKESSLALSIYATDYIRNFPSYIKDHCQNDSCESRFYGGISFSF